MAKKTRLQELEELLPKGYYVRSYNPGGTSTNYRFFDKPGNSYFGPENGVWTADGLKEAMAFARGLAYRNCGRK